MNFCLSISYSHYVVISFSLFPVFQLSDEFSSLVWTTTPEHADTLMALSNESFVDALNSVLVSVSYFIPLY